MTDHAQTTAMLRAFVNHHGGRRSKNDFYRPDKLLHWCSIAIMWVVLPVIIAICMPPLWAFSRIFKKAKP